MNYGHRYQKLKFKCIGKYLLQIQIDNNFFNKIQKSIGSKIQNSGFRGGAVVKNPPANAGDTGSSPGLGRSHMLWSN